MKSRQCLISALLILVLAPSVVPARAFDGMAIRLARKAADLAEDGYRGFDRRGRGNRADVEALYWAQQFSASAALFERMTEGRRPVPELRDALDLLSVLLEAGDRFNFGRRERTEMRRMLADLDRALGGGRPRPGDRYDRREPGDTGRMRWRGTVDGEMEIAIRATQATQRTLSGRPGTDGYSDFLSPLPAARVKVRVQKIKGRGSVDIVQQPSMGNNFTAVVRIRDSKGGDDKYEFELAW